MGLRDGALLICQSAWDIFILRSIYNFWIWTIHQYPSSASFHESVRIQNLSVCRRKVIEEHLEIGMKRIVSERRRNRLKVHFPPPSPSSPPDPENFSNRPSDKLSDRILLKYFYFHSKLKFCEHNRSCATRDRHPTKVYKIFIISLPNFW